MKHNNTNTQHTQTKNQAMPQDKTTNTNITKQNKTQRGHNQRRDKHK